MFEWWSSAAARGNDSVRDALQLQRAFGSDDDCTGKLF